MAEEIFRVRSRRAARVKRVQTAQHAFGALLLILTAVGHLTDPHHHGSPVLPVLEIVTGAGLISTAVRERFSHAHSRVGWVEIAGAAMMFVEAVVKTQQRHHALFYVLSFIPPLMLLAFGIFDEKIRNGIYLKATDDHFELRLRPIFGRRVRWDELRAYRIAPKHLELIDVRDRTRRFRTSDIVEPEPAIAWAVEQFRRRGIPAA